MPLPNLPHAALPYLLGHVSHKETVGNAMLAKPSVLNSLTALPSVDGQS